LEVYDSTGKRRSGGFQNIGRRYRLKSKTCQNAADLGQVTTLIGLPAIKA